jgi:predicted secreted Zn-dependent protease
MQDQLQKYRITYTYPGSKRKLAPISAVGETQLNEFIDDLKAHGAIEIEHEDVN